MYDKGKIKFCIQNDKHILNIFLLFKDLYGCFDPEESKTAVERQLTCNMECKSDIWKVDKIDWSQTFDIGAKLLMGIKNGE